MLFSMNYPLYVPKQVFYQMIGKDALPKIEYWIQKGGPIHELAKSCLYLSENQ